MKTFVVEQPFCDYIPTLLIIKAKDFDCVKKLLKEKFNKDTYGDIKLGSIREMKDNEIIYIANI